MRKLATVVAVATSAVGLLYIQPASAHPNQPYGVTVAHGWAIGNTGNEALTTGIVNDPGGDTLCIRVDFRRISTGFVWNSVGITCAGQSNFSFGTGAGPHEYQIRACNGPGAVECRRVGDAALIN